MSRTIKLRGRFNDRLHVMFGSGDALVRVLDKSIKGSRSQAVLMTPASMRRLAREIDRAYGKGR